MEETHTSLMSEVIRINHQAPVTAYDHYIRVALFCMGCNELLLFVAELNARVPLRGNKITTPICLIHIFRAKRFPLHPFEILICVEGIWYALNSRNTNQKQGSFSTELVVTWAIRLRTTLGDVQRKVHHWCRDMKALMAMQLTIFVGVKITFREAIMNQSRLYTEPSYMFSD